MHYAFAVFAVLTVAFIAWRVILNTRYHPTRVYLESQEREHPSAHYGGKKA